MHKTSRRHRKGNVKVEEQWRGIRIQKRAQALQEWEDKVQQQLFGSNFLDNREMPLLNSLFDVSCYYDCSTKL